MKLEQLLAKARAISWRRFGKKITFYLPGMFTCNNCKGKYPAISITGATCELMCEHCQGGLLSSMLPAETPDRLIGTCIDLAKQGNLGVLISGGCDKFGRLPWDRFLPAIKAIKRQTNLAVSIHSGLVDAHTALKLKQAGVDQALIDVVGDDRTYQEICHVDFGVCRIADAICALVNANLPVIPHIICGLYYGEMRGEEDAAKMIGAFDVPMVAIAAKMDTTRAANSVFRFPDSEAIAGIIAKTRLSVPKAEISLGCARKRGDVALEMLAIDAGINRMALPSEEAVAHARSYGLDIHYQKTCCSVFGKLGDSETWL